MYNTKWRDACLPRASQTGSGIRSWSIYTSQFLRIFSVIHFFTCSLNAVTHLQTHICTRLYVWFTHTNRQTYTVSCFFRINTKHIQTFKQDTTFKSLCKHFYTPMCICRSVCTYACKCVFCSLKYFTAERREEAVRGFHIVPEASMCSYSRSSIQQTKSAKAQSTKWNVLLKWDFIIDTLFSKLFCYIASFPLNPSAWSQSDKGCLVGHQQAKNT